MTSDIARYRPDFVMGVGPDDCAHNVINNISNTNFVCDEFRMHFLMDVVLSKLNITEFSIMNFTEVGSFKTPLSNGTLIHAFANNLVDISSPRRTMDEDRYLKLGFVESLAIFSHAVFLLNPKRNANSLPDVPLLEPLELSVWLGTLLILCCSYIAILFLNETAHVPRRGKLLVRISDLAYDLTIKQEYSSSLAYALPKILVIVWLIYFRLLQEAYTSAYTEFIAHALKRKPTFHDFGQAAQLFSHHNYKLLLNRANSRSLFFDETFPLAPKSIFRELRETARAGGITYFDNYTAAVDYLAVHDGTVLLIGEYSAQQYSDIHCHLEVFRGMSAHGPSLGYTLENVMMPRTHPLYKRLSKIMTLAYEAGFLKRFERYYAVKNIIQMKTKDFSRCPNKVHLFKDHSNYIPFSLAKRGFRFLLCGEGVAFAFILCELYAKRMSTGASWNLSH